MTSKSFSTTQKNKKTLLIVGAIFAGVILFIGGIVFLIISLLKNSDPCQESFKIAQNNAHIIQELGEPIEIGYWVLGSHHQSTSLETAELTIPISGPKGSGTIHLVGTARKDVWTYDTLTFEFDDSGEYVNLLAE